MIINVDSDGCVADFVGGLTPYVQSWGLEPDITQWDLGLRREDFLSAFHEAMRSGLFRTLKPIKGSIEALRQLCDDGHRVRIVTNKIMHDSGYTYLAQSDTLAFYRYHDLLHRVEVVFTGHVYGKTNVPADVVIDDHPNLEWVQPHALNILFDRPWNQFGSLGNGGKHWLRSSGWDSVLFSVNELASGRSPVVF